jgi:hypothetical protein
VDVEATERLEAELDGLIERRARQAADEEHVEELWAESVRRYHEERHRENALAWADYHERQRRALEATLGVLIDQHLSEQDRYRRMLDDIPTTEGEEHA